MAEKLIWTELRRSLATRAGVSDKVAGSFLSSFNAQLIEALKTDKQVKVNGLGTFKLQAVSARKSVNVKTGEEITIPGYNKIVFAPEAGVKELVESNGERLEVKGEREEAIDPLKKLGAQAAEIVDILGELGQSPVVQEEPQVAPEAQVEPEVEPEIPENPENPEPEVPEIPESPENPEPEVEPVVEIEPEVPEEKKEENEEKPKTKHHFWRDTLICVVCLLIVLVIAFFFFRSEISSWIKSFVEENKKEVVVSVEPEVVPEIPESLENPEIPESPESPEVPEVVVEESKYEGWIKTEEITEGSRLAWIAKKYYGDKRYWPYLYDANKDHLDNPSKIQIGTPIRVPKLSKAQKDTTTAEFQELKRIAEEAIR